MIRIITGDKHSGKSTTFLRLYRLETIPPAGLFAEKQYDAAGSITGYALLLLPSEKRLPFVSLKESVAFKESVSPENTGEYELQGRFAFLKKTFLLAERYILSHPANTPVWIDEIGALELKGLGYDTLLKTLLQSGRDLTFTVRTPLLEAVVERYGITAYELL
jgi:nucleoside-triphosphatase THEP1